MRISPIFIRQIIDIPTRLMKCLLSFSFFHRFPIFNFNFTASIMALNSSVLRIRYYGVLRTTLQNSLQYNKYKTLYNIINTLFYKIHFVYLFTYYTILHNDTMQYITNVCNVAFNV